MSQRTYNVFIHLPKILFYDIKSLPKYLAHVSNDASKLRILGECLLISSLPGKALRMRVGIAMDTK